MNSLIKYSVLSIALCFSLQASAQDEKVKESQSKYSYRTTLSVPYTPVKDQARSGTCWSYSGTSFIESEALKKNGKVLDLSEIYSVYHAYREKAEKYVRMHGKSTFSPGGEATDVMDVLRKYGAVPQEVYQGLTDDEELNDHTDLHRELKAFLDTLIKKRTIRGDWRAAFDGILARYIGTPPAEFVYNGKKYTPRTFADKVVGVNADDYIYIVSWAAEPAYEPTVLEVPDNWTWTEYINLPLDDMMRSIDYALEKGYTVAWSSDMSETYFSTPLGMAYVPQDEKWNLYDGPAPEKTITEEMRQFGYDTYRTVDDHAMHIVGHATDDKGGKHYLVKNSWGTNVGYEGMYYASEAFVRYKTICLIINKKAIPADILEKIK